MVSVISSVSGTQNTTLKADAQSSAPATPAPAASSSNANFVTSGIRVDNLQNVAILEYRSSETGDVIQQYPNQAQINAFKAAQHLAEQAKSQAAPAVHHESTAAAPQQAAVPAPAAPAQTPAAAEPHTQASNTPTTAGKTSVVA